VRRNKFSLSNYKLLTANAPVMHPTHAKIHHWFVPNRLIWDDWEKFINEMNAQPILNMETRFKIKRSRDL